MIFNTELIVKKGLRVIMDTHFFIE